MGRPLLLLLLAGGTARATEPDAPVAGEESAPDVPVPVEPVPVSPVPEEPVPVEPVPVEPVPIVPTPTKRRRARPETSTVVTEDLEIRYWQMPDELPGFEELDVLDYLETVARLTVNTRTGGWGFYGQLDGANLALNSYYLDDVRRIERDLVQAGTPSLFLGRPYDPATTGVEGWDLFARNTYVTLEKVRGSFERPDLAVSLGDTYASFGRGIVLDLDRNTEIDLDTSLQGAKLVWRPGPWDVTFLFGQLNRQQVFQDNPNRGLFGDRRHLVTGARVERFGAGPANLGAHVVAYNFTTSEGWEAGFAEIGTPMDVVAGGTTIELLGLGPTDWFLEVDGFAYPSGQVYAGAEAQPGWSAYLSGAIYAGRATVTVEAKRYLNGQRVNALLAPELYQVAIGPTLEYERQITEDSAAAIASEDMWGGRARVDVAAVPGEVTPYAQIAVFRDLDQGGLHFNRAPETIAHALVGVEVTKGRGALLLNLGYRHDDRDGEEFGADRHVHGDLTGKIPLPRDLAIDVNVGAERFWWGVNAIQQHDYTELESSVTLAWQNKLAFTWFTDVSDNPLIDSTGNLTDLVYGAAEIQVRPIPNLTIRAFYGAYKSGIRCSGGQCRVLPGFEGARLAVTGTF